MKTMKRRTSILGLCLAMLVPAAAAFAAEKADYVFKNGAVYTIESKNPKTGTVAVLLIMMNRKVRHMETGIA